MSPADHHRDVAGTFSARVAGTADWDVPTPVDDWVARDVVEHLVSWSRGFLAGGGVDLPPGPLVSADPVAAWENHRAAVQTLLDAPDADRPFTHPFAGTHPLATAIDRFYTTDVFMHTWDLARATGQDDTLDAAFCHEVVSEMSDIEDLMRASGKYGPKVEVPADADPQTRLLGFIGRDPAWLPPVPGE